ncbi:Phyllosphere-induced regulator PhyR [Rhodovastum atsumiense]|uniref:Response regulator n=1 Tax=Rhodovastum atsumiense TaxID=504468 RepID=A0A5M6IQI5_9PROT|nr:response regulator [Rhodovastum atsumiense]KAA5610543.1 response regulator [Rhodovastum atsumiense]CAH2605006.1 Phyllosphere-induced regulator PhyR [Rhodovastum atsumiense]
MISHHREDLLRALPYVRRYARALTGSQAAGDGLVADSVKEILAEDTATEARIALYGAVTRRFDALRSTTIPLSHGLSQRQRQLLLLTVLEEMPLDAAATIVQVPPAEAAADLESARDRLRSAAATDVLIIEDEPIIAMDIEELVQSCGHRVVGVAATETDAVAIAQRCKPGLILADINLGQGGDGTHAVARIMQRHHAPVIFVTAYPERLLTGNALEPAFVITKPFEPLALAIATYQAVTGGVRLD